MNNRKRRYNTFFIKGTDTLLKDELGNLVRKNTHNVKKIKPGLYHYTYLDGRTIEVIHYQTAKSKAYIKQNNEKKLLINMLTGHPLVDSNQQPVFFNDERINEPKFKQYFFTDHNSSERIPVKRYWAFRKERIRQLARSTTPLQETETVNKSLMSSEHSTGQERPDSWQGRINVAFKELTQMPSSSSTPVAVVVDKENVESLSTEMKEEIVNKKILKRDVSNWTWFFNDKQDGRPEKDDQTPRLQM